MNSLTLAIVNDGATYPDRLGIARQVEPRPFAELLQCVAELEAYYANHVAEIDRCAAEDAAAVAAQAEG